MYQALKISQLFCELDDNALDEVMSAAVLKKVEPDEMIFHEGDRAGAFYIVNHGKVKVFKLSPDGKEQILMLAGPGETFAEAALFSAGTYPASAQALEKSELVTINRDRFVALLGKNPDLAVNLIGRLSDLLRKMTRLVEGLSLTSVTNRLAHYLLKTSRNEAGAVTNVVHLKVKKSVLASELGTIPETLSRSLARLTRDGLISVDGPHIKIEDRNRLEKLTAAG
ncbi:MAG: Crp/Fnr family transcriptional regulator [candidate division Zixibacteria bacterium]|nr:Crp/Fnr family transcriptional regulator [candidate division Zixibacteria bacterium]